MINVVDHVSFEQASILTTPKIQRKENIAGSIHNTPVAGAARPRHHTPRFSIGRTYGMHWRHETTLSIFLLGSDMDRTVVYPPLDRPLPWIS